MSSHLLTKEWTYLLERNIESIESDNDQIRTLLYTFEKKHGQLSPDQLYSVVLQLYSFFHSPHIEDKEISTLMIYCTYSLVRSILLEELNKMEEIEDSINYWGDLKYTISDNRYIAPFTFIYYAPLSYYYKKIQSLFNGQKLTRKQYVETHLTQLKEIRKQLVSYFGELHYSVTEAIYVNNSNDQLFTSLTKTLKICNSLFTTLYQHPEKSFVSKSSNSIVNYWFKSFGLNDTDGNLQDELLLQPDIHNENRQDLTVKDSRLIYNSLIKQVVHLKRLKNELKTVVTSIGRPSFIQRNWINLILSSVSFYYLYNYLLQHQVDLISYFNDLKITLLNFTKEYVKQPLLNIYQVIRYDTNHLYVNVVNPQAIQADVDSLSNMLKDYANDHPNIITGNEIINVQQLAEQGDISLIMHDFEKSVQSPVKSLITGELARLLLIQVQKSKVDIERAMLSLDKLLKANELNFEFLAAIPAVLFVALLYSQFRQFYNQTSRGLLQAYAKIKLLLRDAEIVLNRNSCNVVDKEALEDGILIGNQGISFEEYGYFMIALQRLHLLANKLPTKVRNYFIQDLNELEHRNYDLLQRLRVIDRFYRTYKFL